MAVRSQVAGALPVTVRDGALQEELSRICVTVFPALLMIYEWLYELFVYLFQRKVTTTQKWHTLVAL